MGDVVPTLRSWKGCRSSVDFPGLGRHFGSLSVEDRLSFSHEMVQRLASGYLVGSKGGEIVRRRLSQCVLCRQAMEVRGSGQGKDKVAKIMDKLDYIAPSG